jgi:hypothetical protein
MSYDERGADRAWRVLSGEWSGSGSGGTDSDSILVEHLVGS